MPYLPLTQNPLAPGLKQASPEGKRIFQYFVDSLNDSLVCEGHEKLWYQPDNSKWPHRYFWMYHYKSDKRDFIARVEFVSKITVQVDFSHFGARRPVEVEFLPDELFKRLEYKGFPPHVRMNSTDDCDFYVPLIAEHYLRILAHLERGGKLTPRGWSHIEVALKAFLCSNDSPNWQGWDKLDFLNGREVDLSLPQEKIAIEIQGDHWHRLKGQPERDEVKKADLLQNGWRLIWAWESGIREKFHRVEEALRRIRAGSKFEEIPRR